MSDVISKIENSIPQVNIAKGILVAIGVVAAVVIGIYAYNQAQKITNPLSWFGLAPAQTCPAQEIYCASKNAIVSATTTCLTPQDQENPNTICNVSLCTAYNCIYTSSAPVVTSQNCNCPIVNGVYG